MLITCDLSCFLPRSLAVYDKPSFFEDNTYKNKADTAILPADQRESYFGSVNHLQWSYMFLHCYQQLLTLHISSRCKAPLHWEPPSIWHHYHHRQQHTVAGWIVGIHCHSTVVLFGNSFLSWRLVLDFNESQEPHRSIIQWRWVYLNKIFLK